MELIDKNALVEYLERMGNEIYAGNDEYFIGQKAGLMKVVGVIMTFPTVEERKHGRWEGGGAYYCSNCNSYAATDVLAAGWILLNSIIVIIAGLLWTVNPNEHTKVRKINSFIKTNHLENAYE